MVKFINSESTRFNQLSMRELIYGWNITATDHFKAGYLFVLLDRTTGRRYSVVCNTDRDQWIIKSIDAHGDDAASLAVWYCKNILHYTEDEEIAPELACLHIWGRQAIAKYPVEPEFNNQPVIGRSVVCMPFSTSDVLPTIPGLSFPTLVNYGYVAFLPLDGNTEANDKSTRDAMELVRQYKSASEMSEHETLWIADVLRTDLAMPTTGGGCYIWNGTKFQLYGKKGITLCGSDDEEYGNTCYVYDNPFDFLALMEERRKNGADILMSEGQHLIINGDGNLKEALDYLHKRCDYSDVVCMLPNTDHGRELYRKVRAATRDTAVDRSNLFAPHASLYDKVIGRKPVMKQGYSTAAELKKELEREAVEKVKFGPQQKVVVASPQEPSVKEKLTTIAREQKEKAAATLREQKEKATNALRERKEKNLTTRREKKSGFKL